MIFSVSIGGIEWSLDFRPDSVTLTVRDLVQETTIISRQIPLAAWSLLLSQRQEFLNSHLARVPITPNQQGAVEMQDEVLPSLVAQHMDTSRCQVSDLDDVEFYWQNNQPDVDDLCRQGIGTPFDQQRLMTWRWEAQEKTPFSSTKKRTRTLLQKLQSPKNQPNTLCW